MEFYSAIKINETMWFVGKWVELEYIMLSNVSQVQKDKSPVFSLICRRYIQKINVYTSKHYHTHMWECVGKNGNILWNTGEEGKEKRVMVKQY
jgi:hypothetical protein